MLGASTETCVFYFGVMPADKLQPDQREHVLSLGLLTPGILYEVKVS
jgi:hypothetical protein